MAKNNNDLEVSGWRLAVPRYLSMVLRVAAFWSLLGSVFAWFTPPISAAVTGIFCFLGFPGRFDIFSAALLFILSAAVQHRRRIALWAVICYFQLPVAIIGLISISAYYIYGKYHIAEGKDVYLFDAKELIEVYVRVATSIAIIIILFKSRRAFPTKTKKNTWWRAATAILASLLSACVVGVGIAEIFYRTNEPAQQRFVDIGIGVLGKFGYALPFNGLVFSFDTHDFLWVEVSTSAIVIIGLLIAAGFFIHPVQRALYSAPDDELRVRRLLLNFGEQDSLGYFNTRRDKSIIFSNDGQAAIAYRLVGSVLLASGDPIGDKQSWHSAVTNWLGIARTHGWTPAATGTTPTATDLYRKVGLTSAPLGDESVIRVEDFSLADPQMREVQRAVRRANRAGYTVSIRRQPDIPADELFKLERLANIWRQGGPERGFSMASGRFGDPTDRRTVVIVASDSEGSPRGLLAFVPWGTRGLSLDLMRRSRGSINGITAFMVAALVEECRDGGIREIGLNFAVMRRVFEAGEQIEATSFQRTSRRIMLFFSRWWQLESLYRSNEIYQPQWRPRMLCWEQGASLVEVLIAMGQAEGFVPEGVAVRIKRLWRRHSAQNIDDGQWAQPAFIESVKADEERAEQQRVQVALSHLSSYQAARGMMLDRLRGAGIDPYPITVEHTHTVADIVKGCAELIGANEVIAVVGRVMRIRRHGGLCFADIRDGAAEIQVMLDRRLVDGPAHTCLRPETFDIWRRYVSRGDIVSVCGQVILTRTGELTVAAERWQMASKSLQTMPDKRHGITDPHMRIRRREVDIATSSSSFDMVHGRAKILASIRDTFRARGYIEVETPMLQVVHGGANARPFHTHSNAYDMKLSLRIAPELALKRLLAGGVDKIFEMGRNFRNEGVSFKHNPEFTSVEAYEFYTDYTYQMELTRQTIINAAIAVHGEPIAIRPDGTKIDIGGQWPVVTLHEAVSKAVGTLLTIDTKVEEIREVYRNRDIAAPVGASAADLVMGLYDRFVESRTDAPTFFIDIPSELAPLVRQHRNDSRVTEKWDLVVFGLELGTGSTELIDPVIQRERFTEQSFKAAAGDPEAMEIDEDFLSALEFGLRPVGGLGIGVDRLVMILTGCTIRQTLAFPFVKPGK